MQLQARFPLTKESYERRKSNLNMQPTRESTSTLGKIRTANPAELRKAMLFERQNNKQATRKDDNGVGTGKEAQADNN